MTITILQYFKIFQKDIYVSEIVWKILHWHIYVQLLDLFSGLKWVAGVKDAILFKKILLNMFINSLKGIFSMCPTELIHPKRASLKDYILPVNCCISSWSHNHTSTEKYQSQCMERIVQWKIPSLTSMNPLFIEILQIVIEFVLFIHTVWKE